MVKFVTAKVRRAVGGCSNAPSASHFFWRAFATAGSTIQANCSPGNLRGATAAKLALGDRPPVRFLLVALSGATVAARLFTVWALGNRPDETAALVWGTDGYITTIPLGEAHWTPHSARSAMGDIFSACWHPTQPWVALLDGSGQLQLCDSSLQPLSCSLLEGAIGGQPPSCRGFGKGCARRCASRWCPV